MPWSNVQDQVLCGRKQLIIGMEKVKAQTQRAESRKQLKIIGHGTRSVPKNREFPL